MPLQINKVTGAWQNAAPSDANLNSKTVDNEARLTWGTPMDSNSVQSGYGFRGAFPPVKFVATGDRILLGRLRHFNHPINLPCLTSVDLEITIDAARNGQHRFIISLDHDETDNITGDPVLDSDIVTVTGGFPQTLSFPANDGTAKLKVIGFQTEDGDIVEEFSSPERGVNRVWLVAELIDDGVIDPDCDSPEESALNPAGCIIECVPPIEDKPIILDCDVPIPPEAITDCPAIDIPTGVIMDHDDPPPVPPTCIPQVMVSYGFTCVDKREDVRVVIYAFPSGECNTLIYFYFYLYCPPVIEEYGCCWWIWCPCDDGHCSSSSSLSIDTDCPHTDTCSPAPGEWVLSRGTDGYCDYPPCNEGDYYGQVEISCECPCDSSSSSSSSSSSGACCCPDDELPECVKVTVLATDNDSTSPDTWCCDYLDPEMPCTFWSGLPGNYELCQDYISPPIPDIDAPTPCGIEYYGTLDLACVDTDPYIDGCYRTMDTWLYCYEEDGETYWAFYGWLYPYEEAIEGGGTTPIGCLIRKTGITEESCDPLMLDFIVGADDHNDDDPPGQTGGYCEDCNYHIIIEVSPPED